jgi:hypothetical protein
MSAVLLALTLIAPVPARAPSEFLDSLGANSAINSRGESLAKTAECARYLGLRWFRSGYESGTTTQELLELHRQAGVRFSYGFGSGGNDLPKLLSGGRELAKAGALLAFEGPNEPNNWGITYKGVAGGGSKSWKPVAALQRDLYTSVKADPLLKKHPVWGPSEVGAEVDNVGLQFLVVPDGTDVPKGTRYADFVNVHNYIYHPNAPGLEDNKTWNAADPSPACRIDGLYGNHGLTWGHKYKGYSVEQLEKLPKVTTETGTTIGGDITEEIHGLNLLSLYLDQFKRGWSHTAVYLLRDRVDERGNQQFGFYRPDYSPRKAAVYLHNLTSILNDQGKPKKLASLAYSIPNQAATVHDLLLQKSDGSFDLVVWSELVKGTNEVDVLFGRPTSTLTIYDPTIGTAPVRSLGQTRTVHLSLSDHPVVIQVG